MCTCGSLDISWMADGSFICQKCNKKLNRKETEKINYIEYHEDSAIKEIKNIQDEEDIGGFFTIQ